MRTRCLAVSAECAEGAGLAVARHLAASPEYTRCRRLVVYAELPGELPLAGVVALARRDGKRLLWPRQGERGGLEFAVCEHIEELVPGRYGVREPPDTAPASVPGPDALLLVPGLAFDDRGGRLGRGGGAWDRTLAASAGAIAFGVGYEFQIVSAVPREAHDRGVTALLTERGLRRCAA